MKIRLNICKFKAFLFIPLLLVSSLATSFSTFAESVDLSFDPPYCAYNMTRNASQYPLSAINNYGCTGVATTGCGNTWNGWVQTSQRVNANGQSSNIFYIGLKNSVGNKAGGFHQGRLLKMTVSFYTTGTFYDNVQYIGGTRVIGDPTDASFFPIQVLSKTSADNNDTNISLIDTSSIIALISQNSVCF